MIKKGSGLIPSPYDRRDYKFKTILSATKPIEIPKEYIPEKLDYIFDQGNTQMCCACAYNTYRFIQESKESGLTE